MITRRESDIEMIERELLRKYIVCDFKQNDRRGWLNNTNIIIFILFLIICYH